jgi:hypothetical protein
MSASLLLLAMPMATPAANAKPLQPCPEIHAMGQLYGLGKKNVGCSFARRWARHYLRHGQVPRGWVCAGRFFEVGNCHRRHGDALFQFYVQD